MGGPAAAAGDDRDHPFSGYNKKDIHTALVGNWVEERALKADTGIFRYQVRTPIRYDKPPRPRANCSRVARMPKKG
jgi:hypothetical protein